MEADKQAKMAEYIQSIAAIEERTSLKIAGLVRMIFPWR